MKKLFIISICLLTATISIQAQSDFYKKMSDISGVESFYYTKDMLTHTDLGKIQNEDTNLTGLNRRCIDQLEYLSATKRKAIRKLKKKEDNGIPKDSRTIMQINNKDKKLTIYQTEESSYILINDQPKRYTFIALKGYIKPFSLSSIFAK